MGIKVVNNAYGAFLKGIKFLVVLLAIVLVVVVFSNVISRYFLNSAIAWSEELARFLFIWLSFLGAVLANANDEHMRFDLLIKKMPKKLGIIFSIIAYVIILIILFLIAKGGFIVVKGNFGWLSSALEVSYGMVYSVVPFCCVVMALQYLVKLYKTIKSLVGVSQV